MRSRRAAWRWRQLSGSPSSIEFSWKSWSESQAHREPVAPARWEGGHIDITPDRLVPEVAHLGIHPGVIGMGPQIAAAEAQIRCPDATPESRNHCLRNLERQRELAQLQERAVFDVDRSLLGEQPEAVGALGRLQCSVRYWIGVVGSVLAQVVEELGQIDDAAAVLPVQQPVQTQSPEPQVVHERHYEIRICVADLSHHHRAIRQAVVAYDLSR